MSSRGALAYLRAVDYLARGGIAAYGLLCFIFLTHPVALAALGTAIAKRRTAAIVLGGGSVLLGMLTILIGVGGYLYGMSQVDRALMNASPESVEVMREVGQQEAMISVWCALASCLLPTLFGGVALLRALMLPKPQGG